ncbi:MAG TPA: Holliday junction branch migration protein RuvA [Desulfobacteraceae bacterium]|nr:Holliday junction branch migration protein RuvA [Desulfobacteraceae bacterium]
MIASLRGILSYKSTNYVVVDVHGVGYGVNVPLNTFYDLPEQGEEVCLVIHTHVKEDSVSLFGFLEERERDIFHLIISVSGIGPRLAINMLSGINADELVKAVSTGNMGRLLSIPGIGRKMAERLIFELKDKIHKVISGEMSGREVAAPVEEDALSALINLGYNGNVAKKAVDKVLHECGEKLTLETLLTESLKILSN